MAQDKSGTEKPASVPMQGVVPQQPARLTADQLLLTGVIKDTQGETLPGANIRVRETKAGAVADADGKFTLAVPKGQAITVDFSYVGMKPVTKRYDGKKNYTSQVIVLTESGEMEEVVVTGLFDYKSSTFTGSTASYSQEELKMVGNSNVLIPVSQLCTCIQTAHINISVSVAEPSAHLH